MANGLKESIGEPTGMTENKDSGWCDIHEHDYYIRDGCSCCKAEALEADFYYDQTRGEE